MLRFVRRKPFGTHRICAERFENLYKRADAFRKTRFGIFGESAFPYHICPRTRLRKQKFSRAQIQKPRFEPRIVGKTFGQIDHPFACFTRMTQHPAVFICDERFSVSRSDRSAAVGLQVLQMSLCGDDIFKRRKRSGFVFRVAVYVFDP